MKRIFSLLISLIILAFIYYQIDLQALIKVFQNCDGWWMTISLGMVVPLTLLTAWRFQQLMPQGKKLGITEANRLILAASVLNMVLPSKMGDLSKAYFMKQRGHLSGSLSLSLVVFERILDVLSLLLWCVFGLILYPQKNFVFWIITVAIALTIVVGLLILSSRKIAQVFFVLIQKLSTKLSTKKLKNKIKKLQLSWEEMQHSLWQNKRQFLKITLTSIFIWFLHLLQIWFFILALKAWTPLVISLALSPLAILAGLLPLTFAGVGTRDAALIAFYQPYFNAPTAAALGLMCTSRYLLPAIGGIPFLGQYLSAIQKMRNF
ncbi:MAG: lysylphosphatidylglycerol synthase transmembrane domain-containing protein [Nostocaceae cyanobacterium]|nr:lysylphosphatidylglycerol synthase transmembrane domain-containing protein [Nostocaceae cyanobacterium]